MNRFVAVRLPPSPAAVSCLLVAALALAPGSPARRPGRDRRPGGRARGRAGTGRRRFPTTATKSATATGRAAPAGEPQVVTVNLYAGNQYCFSLGATDKSKKVAVTVFDETGKQVEDEQFHQEASARRPGFRPSPAVRTTSACNCSKASRPIFAWCIPTSSGWAGQGCGRANAGASGGKKIGTAAVLAESAFFFIIRGRAVSGGDRPDN